MNQIDSLILDMLDLRLKKHKSIKRQNYDRDDYYRDKEKEISRKIYHLFTDMSESYDWRLFETRIDKYCQDNFGISYLESDSYKQLMREIKIRNLGI